MLKIPLNFSSLEGKVYRKKRRYLLVIVAACEQAKWIQSFLFSTRGRVQAGKVNISYPCTEKVQKNGKYHISVCPLLKCHRAALPTIVSVAFVALEQLLTELEDFLRILDKENLSSTALVKKSFLSDLLRVYTKSSGTGRAGGSRGNGCGVSMQHFVGGWQGWETWKLKGENEMAIIFAVTSDCLCKITIVMCPALQAEDSQDSWSFLFSLLNLKFI